MYFTIRKNEQGKFWWRAVADNNEILADSQMLGSKGLCEEAINIVRAEASTARIIDNIPP